MPVDDLQPSRDAAVDHKTTQSRSVEPVVVSVVGTGDGSKLPTGTVATTPGSHEPNIVVRVVTPIVALAIRFVNVYVGSLVGILGAAMTSNIIPARDFYHLLLKCAGLAVAGAVILLLKDIVTVFSGLEKKFPIATGSV